MDICFYCVSWLAGLQRSPSLIPRVNTNIYKQLRNLLIWFIFFIQQKYLLSLIKTKYEKNDLIFVIEIPIIQTITPFDFHKKNEIISYRIDSSEIKHSHEKYKVSMEFQTKQTRNPIKYGGTNVPIFILFFEKIFFLYIAPSDLICESIPIIETKHIFIQSS